MLPCKRHDLNCTIKCGPGYKKTHLKTVYKSEDLYAKPHMYAIMLSND